MDIDVDSGYFDNKREDAGPRSSRRPDKSERGDVHAESE